MELNLSGTGVESLPDDIVQRLPKLRNLYLDDCKALNFLPVMLGSLKALQNVGVRGCSALMHPPKSQQLEPRKTAMFLRNLHKDSEIWRRLKVTWPPRMHVSMMILFHGPRRLCSWAMGAVARRPCCAHWLKSRCSQTSIRLEA